VEFLKHINKYRPLQTGCFRCRC